jgi:cytochrome c oxidase assembly protein subunit 15
VLDWPTSFHQFNPPGWTSDFGGQKPGVRDEHGHRLIGATVGFLVTVLAIWLATRDPRRWVKYMGLAAWIGVVIQGVMGGLRVIDKSLALAVIHGCFAQAFFCLLVALVAVTSRSWLQPGAPSQGKRAEPADDAALVWATTGAVLVIYIQLILGAVLRHTQTTWIPHLSWAVMVGLAIMTATRYVYQHPVARRSLSSHVVGLIVMYGTQLVLGLATLLVIYPMWSEGLRNPQTFAQTWLPTIHLGVGAGILGLAASLAVRARRLAGRADSLATRAEGVPA